MLNFDSDFDYRGDFVDRWNRNLKKARIWMVVLGILLVLCGIGSALAPVGLYTFIQILVAAALIVRGVSQIASYIGMPELFRNPASLVMGILNALLGVLLLAVPAYVTATTLVFLFGFFFIATGAERLSFSHRLSYFGMQGATASTVTGVLNIILGVAFLLMPLYSSLVLSYLVAAYLIVGGVTLLIEAITMKHLSR